MKHLKVVLLLGYCVCLITCQSKQETAQEAQHIPSEPSLEDTTKQGLEEDMLSGKYFEYGLGCSWEDNVISKNTIVQDNSRSILYFKKGQTFEVYQTICTPNPNTPVEFYRVDCREERIQGTYTLHQKKLELHIQDYQIKGHEGCYTDTTFSMRPMTIQLDSCQGKLVLHFQEQDLPIPNLKHYQWNEKTFSGTFISYAEGVRESIKVRDTSENITISYTSPRHTKPLPLLVSALDRLTNQCKIAFPNKPEESYTVTFLGNTLHSTKPKTSTKQVFFKIRNDFTDNPDDLSLRKVISTKGSRDVLMNDRIPDTTITAANGFKMHLSPIERSTYKKYNAVPSYTKLYTSNCLELLRDSTDMDQLLKCENHVEQTLLDREADARREDNLLIFTLANGQSYFRVDYRNPLESGLRYQGSYAKNVNKVFVFAAGYYETHDYFAVHHSSGEVIQLDGYPAFSPNGRFMITYQNQSLYAFEGVRMQVWENTDYGFDLLWEYIPGFYPEGFVWMNKQKILFTILRHDDTGALVEKNYGQLSFR